MNLGARSLVSGVGCNVPGFFPKLDLIVILFLHHHDIMHQSPCTFCKININIILANTILFLQIFPLSFLFLIFLSFLFQFLNWEKSRKFVAGMGATSGPSLLSLSSSPFSFQPCPDEKLSSSSLPSSPLYELLHRWPRPPLM